MSDLQRLTSTLAAVAVLAALAPMTARAGGSRVGQPYGKSPVVLFPPMCGSRRVPCHNPYRVKTELVSTSMHTRITFRKEGAVIPHLIVRIDSFGSFTISRVRAWVTLKQSHHAIEPRRLRTILFRSTTRGFFVNDRAEYVYVYGLGRILAGATMYIQARIHLTHARCCQVYVALTAYGRFDARGLPDPASAIRGSDVFSMGTQ